MVANKFHCFDSLICCIKECNLCERFCFRNKVFSKYNGNIESKIIFIAEAPGRLGADKTLMPLYGDRTGDNFENLISNIRWSRDEIFITNAVLCNPRKTDGNNDRPTVEEFENCSAYLEMTINLIRPDLIVTLGVSALNALNIISCHNITLKEHVGNINDWNGIKLMPLYHPGPRAVLHRSIAKQRADFIKLANLFEPLSGFKYKSEKSIKSKGKTIISGNFSFLILLIIENYSKISYFKLTKLLFLVDLFFIKSKGISYTGEIYLRQKDGPWPPRLRNVITYMQERGIIRMRNISKMPMIQYIKNDIKVDIDETVKAEILNFIDKYKKHDNSEIKKIVYFTDPMRYILAKENEGQSFLNKPVIYGNKTVIELNKGRDDVKSC
jgi:uracil-DNA glycosylase family 4